MKLALVLVAVLLVGCSSPEQAGTGPSSPTEPPSSVVVTPVPASPHTRPTLRPHEVSPRRIGRLNPDVYQVDRNHDGDFTDPGEDSTKATICTPGWTRRIRPSSSFTNALKIKQLPTGADPSRYEEDHLLPLSLGGAPKDPRNLWPILWERAKLDDVWERKLSRQVCTGELTLRVAQMVITTVKRKP